MSDSTATEINGLAGAMLQAAVEDAMTDSATDLALRAAGYTVLRFTDGDLDFRPAWVMACVRRTLRPR